MNKYFAFLVIAFLTLFFFSLNAGQDSDIVWQKYIFPSECGGAKFSPDGKYIYAAINFSIVKLNALTGDSISTFEGKHSGLDGFNMDISGLGNYIVAESYDGKAIIWDCRNEKIYNYLSETLGKPVSCICIDPFERFILFGLGDYFEVYDIKTLNKITSFRATGIDMSSSLAVKISHDGTKFAITSWYIEPFPKVIKNTISLWDIGTWKKITDLHTQEGDQSGDFYISFSPDDKNIATIFGIIDIITKKRFLPNDGSRVTRHVDFCYDNYHCFYYNIEPDGYHSFNLYNINSGLTEKKYQIYSSGIDWNANTSLIISNSRDWLTMLKPIFTSISFNDNTNNNLKVLLQNNMIILDLSTIQNGNSQLLISDLNGKNIYKQDLGFVNQENTKYFIDIELPSGIYLCKVIVGPKVYSQKFEIVI